MLDLSDSGNVPPHAAVRFRLGSSFGTPGRVRPRVMAHRKCVQERSDQIQASQPVEDMWIRSRRLPSEFYSISAEAAE